MFRAVLESKNLAWSRLRSAGSPGSMAPWALDDLGKVDAIFGNDPWPNGLEANRANLETMMGYLVEQGLMPHAMPLEDLFLGVEEPG